MLICQYCKKENKSSNGHRNHERLCPKNASRQYKNGMTGKTAWNKGLTKEDPRIRQSAESFKKAYKEGRVDKSYLRDPEFIKKQSENAKRAGCGGYRENAGRSKKFHHNDSFGKTVCLQSTYELRCAKILDELGIQWIRPKHIKYNETKKYFPDFYLTDYNLYLDPKNSFLAKKDKEKISCVCDQNNVTVLILTEDKLTEEYIKTLVSPNGEGLS